MVLKQIKFVTSQLITVCKTTLINYEYNNTDGPPLLKNLLLLFYKLNDKARKGRFGIWLYNLIMTSRVIFLLRTDSIFLLKTYKVNNLSFFKFLVL